MTRRARAARTMGPPPTAATFVVLTLAGLASLVFAAGLAALLVLAVLQAMHVPAFRVVAATGATVGLVSIGLLVAAPVAVGTAVWAAWFAPLRLRAVARALLLILGDVPPALWALAALVEPSAREVEGALVFASLALGAVAAPTIAARTLRAVERVPAARVLAARSLGLTAAESVYRVVLPSASSAIARAVLLGAARAVADAVVILLLLSSLLPWAGLPLLVVDPPDQPLGGAALVAVVWAILSTILALGAHGLRR